MALGRVRRCGTRRWRNRMTAKIIMVLCAALLVFCIALGALPDEVYAQGASGDQDDEAKGVPPTKTQMAIGIGSFIIMIIVVKWL